MNLSSFTVITNLSKKAFWRFWLLFLFFYIVPNDLGYFTDATYDLTTWDQPIMWIGEMFFDWEVDPHANFKGNDSRFELCRYIFVFLVAFFGTFLWLFLDRFIKKQYTTTLKVLTQTILRYHIAFTLINYGLSKVFMLQFGTMCLDMLEMRVGNLPGMSLLWGFFSHSEIVTMVSGWLEVIGSLLLLFRKTTFLGAIILIGVMANVVLFDIGYSVNVTSYAVLLFCLLLLLISTQLKRTYLFLIAKKTTKTKPYASLIPNKKIRWSLKFLMIVVMLFFELKYYYDYYKTKQNETAWFTNLQTVETFVINGDTLSVAEKHDNEKAWKKISFNGFYYYPETFRATFENNKQIRFKFEIDSTTNSLRFRPNKNEDAKWSEFSYKKLKDKKYTFEGVYEGDSIFFISEAKYLEDYKLIKSKKKIFIDDW